MIVEVNLLISILKLTKSNSVIVENVKRDSLIQISIMKKLLQNLQSQGLIYLKGDNVTADTYQRLKLAVKAVSLGADIEQVCSLLCWQEFEEIAAIALRNNGYEIAKNLRFKNAGRRREIDVVGWRKPLVVCIDCKHYHHGMSPSVLQRVVESQIQRTKALVETLPNAKIKLAFTAWGTAKFVPAILSLFPGRMKFYNAVPVVAILQLQDFISQLPLQVDYLTHISKEFNHLSNNT